MSGRLSRGRLRLNQKVCKATEEEEEEEEESVLSQEPTAEAGVSWSLFLSFQ
jgi:hypothetical protein